MESSLPPELERAEVERVLQSGIFAKSPRLSRFFCYVCERHLEGRGDQIKEYSIALEALGRSPDFDPKKDSIVRVEAHRLRKRLEEYYSGVGRDDAIHVIIPNGQYRPIFVIREHQAALSPAETALPLEEAMGQAPGIQNHSADLGGLFRLLVGLLVACLVLGVFLWFARRGSSKVLAKPMPEVWTGLTNEPVASEEFRMAAGYHGPAFVDGQGHTWNPDSYFTGGVSTPLPLGRLIQGTIGSHFFKAQRSGAFRYDIPLRQGTYELHLYFAETEYGYNNPKGGSDGSRAFQISINDSPQLRAFDPLVEAGAPNRLHERVFKDVTPINGKLHLSFAPFTGPAFLNGLALLPTPAGRVRPIRIVTQPSPVTDSDGRVWAADEYFCGGTLVARRNLVTNAKDKALYQGERYGNFFYHLPLAAGKYRLTLHFAETYFGTPESNISADDARIFDVYANGVALLRNYQIAKDAGGPNRAIAKAFDNVEPNAQGVLAIEFVPVRNYAEVNAIEVVQTE